MTPFPAATVLGYPRIGRDRETKRAVEAFWSGRTTAEDLDTALAAVRAQRRDRLVALGLDPSTGAVPADFSAYDHVLDAAVAVGAIPHRFRHLLAADGTLDASGYFTLARGAGELAPLEMTKWFDSNYHYLVPEIGPDTPLRAHAEHWVEQVREASAAGVTARPVLVGPVTLLLLAKSETGAPAGFAPLDRLDDLLPVYAEILRDLASAGAPWVELDEPALVVDTWDVPRERVLAALTRSLEVLASDLARPERPALLVGTPYGDADDALPVLGASAVEAVGLDLVRGPVPTTAALRALADKTVVAGAVDGRNVWRDDLAATLTTLEDLAEATGGPVAVATSTSLLHVPLDADRETALDPALRGWLAFADQKVGEVVTLARGLADGREQVAAELAATAAARAHRSAHPGGRRDAVRARTGGLDGRWFRRAPVADRTVAQAELLDLPPLPTTTIGSFPQTGDIRRARAAHRRGETTDAQYAEAMRAEIARVVALQEDLGLDVLVHGEPERNDMVQYFAEHLDGFATTRHGWVQSYGSRCTRPSILWGDVSRPAPITVEWTRYAQSLTAKPVKGMLTGPVTILAWSFVRDDQPLRETANQVALALRDEVADLEAAGTTIVQVDEPALRELLPLRRTGHARYLEWSVGAFRLATGGAGDGTQVHTHLCYSEFGEVVGAIDALDADVTSIEAARSRMEILGDLAGSGFDRGIGPGVYDIHSPRVPSVDEVAALLDAAVRAVPVERLWVNPDCGLKTRGYEETVASLRNLVAAARTARERVGAGAGAEV